MPLIPFSRSSLRHEFGLPELTFWSPALAAVAEQAVEHFCIAEQSPIVVTDEGDIDHNLTAYADRIRRTKRSPLTAITYAREAELFARYLREAKGKSLSDVLEIDFIDYRRQRLDGPISIRLEPTTWNKVCAALLRLARHMRIQSPDLIWSEYRAGAPAADRVRMIGLDHYLAFLEHGMRAGPRNYLRNTAFSEFLVTTGARCSEAAALLRHEFRSPAAFGDYRSIPFELPAAITKGNRKREIYYSRRVAKEYVEAYVSEERAHQAHVAIDSLFPRRTMTLGQLEEHADFIFFVKESRSKLRIIAGAADKVVVPMRRLSPVERRKLIEIAPSVRGRFEIVDIGALWLSERGLGMSTSAWNAVFSAASARASKTSPIPLEVSPHVLRHTYAVHYLSFLLKGLIELRAECGRLDRRGEVYDRIIGDPLRQLQHRLGHAHIHTTYKYLTYVEDNQELVDQATAEWDRRIDALQLAQATDR